jgi:hypothetical protein
MSKKSNERITKIMGLAASQARFLCITARKADCQYKSTDLAQQKLEITNQLSSVSNDYANSLNATKLMWSNDAVDADLGLSYSLLMMPSAANDYDPYMLTTQSGAIVLNSEYAAAAKAAGISKGGGIGSQTQRDTFIQSLASGGVLTQDTANQITIYDNVLSTDKTNVTNATSGIAWNAFAGLGAEPKNKNEVDAMQLSDLILSDTIGQVDVDWAQLVKGTVKVDGVDTAQITQTEYDNQIDEYDALIKQAKNQVMSNALIAQLQTNSSNGTTSKALDYANKINGGEIGSDSSDWNDAWSKIKTQLENDKADYIKKYTSSSNLIVSSTSDKLNSSGNNSIVNDKYNISVNGLVRNSDTYEDMNIGDILTSNVMVTYTDTSGNTNATSDFKDSILTLFQSIIKQFGYSSFGIVTGQGLNVDEDSAAALQFAEQMIETNFLRTMSMGENVNSTPISNSAFKNADVYNRITTASKDKTTTCSVSLSNMLSAFLTYYDNALNGTSSDYVVGKTLDTSNFVTDNSSYCYVAQDDENTTTMTEKNADFYDELYNNILAHGWREDSAIDDSEYLESMIKDGRYTLSSLNDDGYFYQSRYNETGYIVEVSDTDAIARAEAEFTAKKAELTYKEDAIDLKIKKLDTEISALTTEYDSVKTLISNSIQKTFQMFQS